mmetsp:Transcript_4852/g.11417  ORF Transcript_4852/g.11417 Transcript_4852/m.11417 type:complete len:274 (-) Transcript_4852:1025-1846(-)
MLQVLSQVVVNHAGFSCYHKHVYGLSRPLQPNTPVQKLFEIDGATLVHIQHVEEELGLGWLDVKVFKEVLDRMILRVIQDFVVRDLTTLVVIQSSKELPGLHGPLYVLHLLGPHDRALHERSSDNIEHTHNRESEEGDQPNADHSAEIEKGRYQDIPVDPTSHSLEEREHGARYRAKESLQFVALLAFHTIEQEQLCYINAGDVQHQAQEDEGPKKGAGAVEETTDEKPQVRCHQGDTEHPQHSDGTQDAGNSQQGGWGDLLQRTPRIGTRQR